MRERSGPEGEPVARRATSLLLACLILLGGFFALRPYLTDDTYIHLQYARNLAERGELAFNPGERAYGASSPLWVFGLAGLLAAGVAPPAAAKGLGLFSGLLVLLVLEGLLRGLRVPRAWKLVILPLAAADAWLLRWSASGMETPLATALLLVLLWPVLRPPRPGSELRALVAWGAAAGLAGLTRPEFLLLAPAALPWVVWRLRATAVLPAARALAAAAAGWLVAAGPWLVFAAAYYGRLAPETAAAKSGALVVAPEALVASAARSAGQLAATQVPLWAAVLILAAIALAAGRGRGGSGRRGGAPPPDPGLAGVAVVGIAATWALLLAGGYAVKQVWVISRYLAPLAPALLLAVAVVAGWLLAPLAGRARRAGLLLLAVAALATAGLNGWWLLARVRPHAVAFGRDLAGCYLATGDWLRESTPPGTVVAALDVGAIGWAGERRVMDLMGLVSPEVGALGRELGFEPMIESGAWLGVEVPDYLVDRTAGPPRWEGREVSGVRFELLRTCTLAGVGLREPEPWTVALYALRRGPDPSAGGD